MSKRAWEEEKRRDRERKDRAQKMAQERLIERQNRDIDLDGE